MEKQLSSALTLALSAVSLFDETGHEDEHDQPHQRASHRSKSTLHRPKQSSLLLTVPFDVMKVIVTYLHLPYVLSLSRVCMELNQLCLHDQSLWVQLLRRDYPQLGGGLALSSLWNDALSIYICEYDAERPTRLAARVRVIQQRRSNLRRRIYQCCQMFSFPANQFTFYVCLAVTLCLLSLDFPLLHVFIPLWIFYGHFFLSCVVGVVLFHARNQEGSVMHKLWYCHSSWTKVIKRMFASLNLWVVCVLGMINFACPLVFLLYLYFEVRPWVDTFSPLISLLAVMVFADCCWSVASVVVLIFIRFPLFVFTICLPLYLDDRFPGSFASVMSPLLLDLSFLILLVLFSAGYAVVYVPRESRSLILGSCLMLGTLVVLILISICLFIEFEAGTSGITLETALSPLIPCFILVVAQCVRRMLFRPSLYVEEWAVGRNAIVIDDDLENNLVVELQENI